MDWRGAPFLDPLEEVLRMRAAPVANAAFGGVCVVVTAGGQVKIVGLVMGGRSTRCAEERMGVAVSRSAIAMMLNSPA